MAGSDKTKSRLLEEKLEKLLETYSIFYQNARGFHWDITGKKFFELHERFEEQYNDLLLEINDAAEPIYTPGFTADSNDPLHAQLLAILESKTLSDTMKSADKILETFKTVILMEREIPELSPGGRMKKPRMDQ